MSYFVILFFKNVWLEFMVGMDNVFFVFWDNLMQVLEDNGVFFVLWDFIRISQGLLFVNCVVQGIIKMRLDKVCILKKCYFIEIILMEKLLKCYFLFMVLLYQYELSVVVFIIKY